MVNYTLPITRSCALCAASSYTDICSKCDRELPRINVACQWCGIPFETGELCGECLTDPPVFARCIAPLRYEAPVSHLLGAFKYQGNFNYGRILSALLIERLRREQFEIDTIVPVPLHWRRRWQRGFNQAELIADELSSALSLPMQPGWIRRTRSHAPQQSLDAEARRKNLHNAFQCKGPLRDLRIAVVDDVVTTGATANTIARTLLAAGAASVDIWCLARTL
jgi:ComF family protein